MSHDLRIPFVLDANSFQIKMYHLAKVNLVHKVSFEGVITGPLLSALWAVRTRFLAFLEGDAHALLAHVRVVRLSARTGKMQSGDTECFLVKIAVKVLLKLFKL